MNYVTAEAEDNREKILKFIVKYIKRHCYPPATYEIAADTGLSKATVRRHIAMLLEDHILETEHPGDESKSSGDNGAAYYPPKQTPPPAPADGADGFMNIPDGIEEELPFS